MKPLAEEVRPLHLKDFVGQEKIYKLLKDLIKKDDLPSMIFYGPTGTGKTTLAKIIAKETHSHFEELNAVTSGLKDLKIIIERAETFNRLQEKTILFIDEIHRWNRKQQDALLPFVEDGTIILIGATTENPSFEVNEALLSRCNVVVFKRLEEKDLKKILKKTVEIKNISIEASAINFLASIGNGDARIVLNILENGLKNIKGKISKKDIEEIAKANLYYDKNRREHHNLISALIKSMRAGRENAAIYYLVRMLESGEDPLFIARRIVVFASEDVGIANSLALNQAVAAFDACRYLGMPECRLNLIQAVVYMSRSTKSRKLYDAYEEAKKDALFYGNLEVPAHLRNYDAKYLDKEDFDYKEFLPRRIQNKTYLK